VKDNLVEVHKVHNAGSDTEMHIWAVRGKHGGVHVWAKKMNAEAARISGSKFYGGIEVHRARPAEYDDPANPSHDECWLINAPCWHDGSSLKFEEIVAPLIRSIGFDKVSAYCLSVARDWYQSNFGNEQ